MSSRERVNKWYWDPLIEVHSISIIYKYVRNVTKINLKVIKLQNNNNKKKIIHDHICINQLMLDWKKSVYKLKSAILNLI